MFHAIPPEILAQMGRLEQIDTQDRLDGTPRQQRLRQIPRVTGRFLSMLAALSPPGEIVEVGTSAGYSTLWLSLAARETDRIVTTFETLPAKTTLAKETFAAAAVDKFVRPIEGDAREHLGKMRNIAFCFLDTEKEIYADCYELTIPNLVPGGLLVADNAISHLENLQPFFDRALADQRVDALIATIGKGLLICRKSSMDSS